MRAPFPFFGGKTAIVAEVWSRLGRPKQYIEPFCGSAAILLGAKTPASLEVVNDMNGFIANFWRAVKHQPQRVAEHADYPVSHVDLGARHRWLMEQRNSLGASLQDPHWPGDAEIAGWWLWGQCCWIGSGWCDWFGQVPHAGNPGRGVQAIGKVPHASDAGRGVQAIGKVPHASDAGRNLLTSSGIVADLWLRTLSNRLERVRITHGEWDRCLNNHYGGADTAVFLDPPYSGRESVYGNADSVSSGVMEWCRENEHLRIALCGLRGEYDELSSWTSWEWSRGRLTYGGSQTTADECVWFSPACYSSEQRGLAFVFEEAKQRVNR